MHGAPFADKEGTLAGFFEMCQAYLSHISAMDATPDIIVRHVQSVQHDRTSNRLLVMPM